MTPRSWIAIGAVLAAAYLAVGWLGVPASLAVAVKGAATAALLLAALAGRGLPGGAPGAGRLAAGLACHLLGDVLIETAPLPAAMAAFLAGHLVYLSLFVRWRLPGGGVAAWRRALAFALVADAAVLIWLVIPRAGDLALPVAFYSVALLAMALAATVAAAPPALAAGAALYVLSDSLLAFDLFVAPLPAADLLTWPTYWLGQALIVAAVLRRTAAGAPAAAPRVAAAA